MNAKEINKTLEKIEYEIIAGAHVYTPESVKQILNKLDEIIQIDSDNKFAKMLSLKYKTLYDFDVKRGTYALPYAMQMLEYAKELNKPCFIYLAQCGLGSYYSRSGDTLTAFDYFWKALQTLQKNKNEIYEYSYDNYVSASWNNIASCLSIEGNYEEALELYERAYAGIGINTQDEWEINKLCIKYINSISIYFNLNNAEKALSLTREAQAYMDQHPKVSLYPCMLTYSFVAEEKYGDKNRAEEFLKKVGEIDDFRKIISVIKEFIETLIVSEREDIALHYINRFFKAGEQAGNVEWKREACMFKKKFFEHINLTDSEEYKQTCVLIANLIIEKDERIAKTRKESLKTYMTVMEKNEEQEKLKATHDMLKHKSEYDELTGLPNRYKLTEFCLDAFERAIKEKLLLSVEIIDIDFFKQVNDNYGHAHGDFCLKSLASEIQKAVEKDSETEICARFGGDEFVIVRLCRSDEEIIEKMEMLKAAVCALNITNEYSKVAKVVTVSQGAVNRVPSEREGLTEFLKMADEGLYEAKKISKNTVVLVHAE